LLHYIKLFYRKNQDDAYTYINTTVLFFAS